nr:MAG TPA: hypothetical protein [Crassvirales sp.]
MIDFNDKDIYKKANVEFPTVKKNPQASKALNKVSYMFRPYSNIIEPQVDNNNYPTQIKYHMNIMRASKLELLHSYQEGNKERIGYIYGVPIVTKNATSSELSIQDIINACFFIK